jgi:hypothetical protein
MFHSLKTLRTFMPTKEKINPAHDYLDGMETIF